MRRLGRWTLNALTVLSLLLCVGTVSAWVACRGQAHSHRFGSRQWPFVSIRGRQGFATFSYGKSVAPSVRGQSPAAVWRNSMYRHAKFCPGVFVIAMPVVENSGPRVLQRPGMVYALDVSFWWLLAVTAALPTGRLAARIVRRGKRRSGGCLDCGYDLTGNVSGVCPECGTAVAKG